jgi:hypothetical protein
MRRELVECEDGRSRQARVYGEPRSEEAPQPLAQTRRVCPSCDGQNPADALYCCYCGKGLPELPKPESKSKQGQFSVYKAGVRVKGKHVQGEAWQSKRTGIWYFISDPEGKNYHLLTHHRERPDDPDSDILKAPGVRRA